jgi:hypothetical protein
MEGLLVPLAAGDLARHFLFWHDLGYDNGTPRGKISSTEAVLIIEMPKAF